MLDFPEESPNSNRLEHIYDRVKRGELSKFPWNPALVRVALTRDVATPAFEYSYQFSLPAGLLRILKVWPEGYRWKREGLKLLSDLSTASILYIDNIGEGLFTDAMAAVVSARLAILIAEPLTERPEKVQQAERWYVAALSEAKHLDSQESSMDQISDNSAVTVRTGWGEPYRYRPVVTS